MNSHDYETLMHHTGAPPPSHALAIHPQHAAPPSHAVQHAAMGGMGHPVHDARQPAPPPQHVLYAQPHPQHAPPPGYHYPPPPMHAFEHEPHPGYSQHRHHLHERHDRHLDDDRPRRRSSKHQTSAEDIRTFPIGFKQTNIAAGDVVDIEVKPQVRFQGRRLAIAPSIGRYFDVVDIKVGKDSQLAATGELAGECVSALAVDVRVELDPAPPGIVITISVRNNDAVAHDFRAVLYGLVEEVDD
jgi:hypothetical protein